MCHKIGLPATGTIGLGIWSVCSASRVPNPPARMATRTMFDLRLSYFFTSRSDQMIKMKVSDPRCDDHTPWQLFQLSAPVFPGENGSKANSTTQDYFQASLLIELFPVQISWWDSSQARPEPGDYSRPSRLSHYRELASPQPPL